MKVRIELDMNPLNSKIYIDGKEFKRVISLDLNVSPKNIPIIGLQLVPDEIEIIGEALILNEKPLGSFTDEEIVKELVDRQVNKAFGRANNNG